MTDTVRLQPLRRRVQALVDRPGAGNDPAPAILASPEVRNANSFIGIPLELVDGTRFGTLCAISDRAKRFHREEVDLLTVLGRVIVNELERERKVEVLQVWPDVARRPVDLANQQGIPRRFTDRLERNADLRPPARR